MGVGPVGGGGRGPKGPKGVGGGKGAAGAGKAGGAGKSSFGGKVDKAESLVGASGLVGSGNVGATDPVSASALEIVRQLKSGEIKSRDEARKKLISTVLKEKLHMQSKLMTDRIADALQDDPHSSQVLERILSKG
ncbi:MAG: hypothetical protein ACT4TC_21750 [Myxococcaceae bacterium]